MADSPGFSATTSYQECPGQIPPFDLGLLKLPSMLPLKMPKSEAITLKSGRCHITRLHFFPFILLPHRHVYNCLPFPSAQPLMNRDHSLGASLLYVHTRTPLTNRDCSLEYSQGYLASTH